MVSILTWFAVKPCSKLTSAANSSVQTLVDFPKVRGLWCNKARRASHLAWSNWACTVFGREDSCLRHSTPSSSNAWMALPDGLRGTAQILSDDFGALFSTGGELDLAATQGKGIGGAQSSF